MFRRLSVMLLVSVVFAFPAVAQALDPVHPDTFLYTAQTVLLILGMAFCRVLGVRGIRCATD